MIRIQLPSGEWWYDEAEPLGPEGGFGAVFAGGRTDTDRSLAVKLLHLSAADAAHRELRIATELTDRDYQWVVPVLDSGQDAETDRYFIIMERAEQSLADRIVEGEIDEAEATEVLLAIASGLVEVGDLVHRDLKPGNVLLHGDRWKLADFGIARFVAESTSLNTLREALTFAYAAPEQWRLERSVKATDVYALGCIAHSLLNGAPPFPGPEHADYQEQHLNASPPELACSNQRLKGLVAMMLRKQSETRPSVERVAEVLGQPHATPSEDSGGARSILAEAGAAVAEESGRAEAEAQARQRADEYRRRTASDATDELHRMITDLFERISEEAPAAQVSADGTKVTLGRGELSWYPRFPHIPAGVFEHSGWNVVVGAEITVTQESSRYRGRAANLWFTDSGTGGELRWIEVPYMFNALMRGTDLNVVPFAVSSLEDADIAHSGLSGSRQCAALPAAIDGEDFEEFANRWMERLALAAQVRLDSPSRLPES